MSGPIRPFEVPPVTRGDRLFHGFGATLNGLLTVWGLVWTAQHFAAVAAPWYVLALAVAAGLFVADFLTGLLHWAFDTWFDECVGPIRRVVVIVREHHIYPQNIFRYRFIDECGPVSLAALSSTAPVYLCVTLDGTRPSLGGFAAVVGCLVISVCMVAMLQTHKLGHRRTRSRALRLLQGAHLVMSARHHSRHHCGRRDIRYCLINGWADLVLDAIGFWRFAERAIVRATGATPRRNDLEWLARYDKAPAEDANAGPRWGRTGTPG